MTSLDLRQINAQLEGASPQDILRWAAGTFDSICLQSSMQRRGSALVHMIYREGLTFIPVLFVDTGYHFPETLRTRDILAERYGIEVITLYPEMTPEQQDRYFGRELWCDPEGYETCCDLRKVAPFVKAASRFDAVISGIQRAEGGRRGTVPIVAIDPRAQTYVIHPLATWPQEAVDRYNIEHDVTVHPLHAASYPSIGCATCTTPVRRGEDDRAGRWRHIREALEAAEESLYCNINWVDQRKRAAG